MSRRTSRPPGNWSYQDKLRPPPVGPPPVRRTFRPAVPAHLPGFTRSAQTPIPRSAIGIGETLDALGGRVLY